MVTLLSNKHHAVSESEVLHGSMLIALVTLIFRLAFVPGFDSMDFRYYSSYIDYVIFVIFYPFICFVCPSVRANFSSA